MHTVRTRATFAALGTLALGTLALGTLALGTLALAARAANDVTYDLTYSGASFGNTATAAGTVTLDISQINNPGTTAITSGNHYVTALNLTVSGAGTGDGTFTLADYNPADGGTIGLNTGGATLDFTKPLLGQSGFGPGGFGDFNLFTGAQGITDGAPYGSNFFTLSTSSKDKLILTGFSPAAAGVVPEPSGLLPMALGLAGLGALAFVARKRKMA